MEKHWSVSVNIGANNILNIGDNYLSGWDDVMDYADTVQGCAEHLLSFIGRESETTTELRAEVSALTALCDGYRGEIQTLTNTVEYLKQEDGREIQRLKVACECHRIQAVDRGNSYQKAASEVERLQAIVTALEEGCHSCQHPKRVGELTCQKNALQQVVAERDTEIERLKHWDSLLCPRCHGVREVTVMSGQTPESYSEENIPCPDCVGPIIDERDAAVSALTRARADAFEESAEIASDTLYNTVIWGCDGDCNSPEIVAKAIRARAAKGEQ